MRRLIFSKKLTFNSRSFSYSRNTSNNYIIGKMKKWVYMLQKSNIPTMNKDVDLLIRAILKKKSQWMLLQSKITYTKI